MQHNESTGKYATLSHSVFVSNACVLMMFFRKCGGEEQAAKVCRNVGYKMYDGICWWEIVIYVYVYTRKKLFRAVREFIKAAVRTRIKFDSV